MKKILITDDSNGWVKHHTLNVKYILGEENVSISQAFSAKEAESLISANIDKPFDIIFTDLQMETDFLPKSAGEWFLEQIKFYKEYQNSLVVVISASLYIDKVANKHNVKYIPKKNCQTLDSYKKILENT